MYIIIHVKKLFAHYSTRHAFVSKAQQSLTIAARNFPPRLELQLHSFGFGESDRNVLESDNLCRLENE